VVNNAGICYFSPIRFQTLEELQKVMDVNFWGMVRTNLAMLPFLKKTKAGRIVNVSSAMGVCYRLVAI